MSTTHPHYHLGLRATAGAWQYESGLRPSSEARSNCGEANFNTSEPAALFCRTEISTCSTCNTLCFVLSPPDKKSDYRSRSQEQHIDRLTLQTSHQELCSQPDADSHTGKRIGHLSTRTLGVLRVLAFDWSFGQTYHSRRSVVSAFKTFLRHLGEATLRVGKDVPGNKEPLQ
ncbi:hypothetical protein DFH06DRAFT_1121028 [Mycena polygramma]|nr:hypothetical protein DFH06DRAFT_1121028 [Mycena polygramma]